MVYVIYLDILWLTNFIMDIFLLIFVKKLRGLSATIRNILVSAMTGAAGVTVMSCFQIPGLLYFAGTGLALPYLMVRIAFQTKNIKSNLLNLITLYLSSAMTAGLIQMIFCHTPLNMNRNNAFIRTVNNNFTISWLQILVCTAGISAGIVILTRKYLNCKMPSNCKVILTIHGQRIDANALIDTGNGLYDPVSQKPVSVIYEAYFKQYFYPQDIQTMRMIPMRTVGGEHRMLTAIRIDGIDVCIHGQSRHFTDVYVAFDTHRFGTNEVLLHPDMWRL